MNTGRKQQFEHENFNPLGDIHSKGEQLVYFGHLETLHY